MAVATQTIEELSINAIRALSMDAVQAANSGHPGLPMGAAPMAYALWHRHLCHNPKDPKWFNRDRFILSAGHGSMLLYSLLYLSGYDLPLAEIKRFRQLHSQTPGHPENVLTPGVEMATGPLGQGFAHAVGFAIAERWLAATFNQPGHNLVDHYTYVICSDGDLMEGVSYEASSLAGHLKLGKLIVLYDDNDISLDGPTSLSVSENHELRFRAAEWHVQRVDGMNVDAVDQAIQAAQQVTDMPSIIMCKTIIGFGSPNKQGTSKSHGSALGPDEVKLAKQNLGIPLEPDFYVADAALEHWRQAVDQGEKLQREWAHALNEYAAEFPDEAKRFRALLVGEFGRDWLDALPVFTDEKQATRKASNTVINAVADKHFGLLGGSADLSESTLTTQKSSGQFTADNPSGRNVFFGVREHAMIAAVNGITLHGGAHGYGGSFFTFTDYCRPSIRLAALMECPSTYVFTHDSVGLGEDGPTHQPVEHLTAMRSIPNLNVFRPCDGNETSAGWKIALESKRTPTLLVLSRQNLPTLSSQDVRNHPAEKGAYILQEAAGGKPQVILIGTGSEVSTCAAAKALLDAEGISARVVSMPSWWLFAQQSKEYQASVLGTGIPRVSVEAGSTLAWPRYSDVQVGIDRFGLSAPGEEAMKEFGITPENVAKVAKEALRR
ncbi:transketolase [Fimbriimonas ginsengisoli]|uniref:Transketolase n=1 Tax=Fimbriimonas ginsengisoli Gsoil 348 TaxID=661478 RepID=A0A068NY00_FIMGI|nr:transketolase [Fimbriimonas ginsengisoli]AIE86534.1 transketolase [Fimbriimonas ginsengisoli Gsoil 348]